MKVNKESRTVWFSTRDTAILMGNWPGSELAGQRAVFQFAANGDLVDCAINGGDSSKWDGPELLALADDAFAVLKRS